MALKPGSTTWNFDQGNGCIIPIQSPELLNQPDVAFVLFVSGTMLWVGVRGVAAFEFADTLGWNALERLIPVNRIVPAGLPRVNNGDQAILVAANLINHWCQR